MLKQAFVGWLERRFVESIYFAVGGGVCRHRVQIEGAILLLSNCICLPTHYHCLFWRLLERLLRGNERGHPLLVHQMQGSVRRNLSS